jgi:glycosyltransferase involved in cell wall biosynthesis
MKKRLAIWLHGGLGTGHFDQGYPMLEHLLRELSGSFEIVVYSMSAPNADYTNNDIEIITAPREKRNTTFRWLALASLFVRDHRRMKYDVIFAFWGWPAGVVVLLGKVLRVPSAVYLLGADAAGVPSISYGVLHRPLLKAVVMWAYHRCSLLLGISGYQRDTMISSGLRRPMTVIPWGADPAVYKFKPRQHAEILHFIHVGHLTPVKDQETLLRAFALISRQRASKLRIFGVDCMDGYLQGLCKTLAIDDLVEFCGMKPYNEIPSQYDWAHIMLHTSLSEGQSMALTEGAASGLLLAGTPVGLLYDLKEECGVIANIGDHQTLASRVLQIASQPDEWSKRILNAKNWSEHHTLLWTVRALTAEINNL